MVKKNTNIVDGILCFSEIALLTFSACLFVNMLNYSLKISIARAKFENNCRNHGGVPIPTSDSRMPGCVKSVLINQ